MAREPLDLGFDEDDEQADEADEAAEHKRLGQRQSSLPDTKELPEYADKAIMHLLTRVLSSRVRITKMEHLKPVSDLVKSLTDLRERLGAGSKPVKDMTPEERKQMMADLGDKVTKLTAVQGGRSG